MKTQLFQIPLIMALLLFIPSACVAPTPMPPTTATVMSLTATPAQPTLTSIPATLTLPLATTIPPIATSAPPTYPPTPITTATPQPNVELQFFYDWNPQDPFNLQGNGLNSKRDPSEPFLIGLTLTSAGQSFTTDGNGTVRLLTPETTLTMTISVPNTNKQVSQKNLADLGIQFTMTMYEPNRVNYGPRFVIDFRDDNCQRSNARIVCEIGLADGYITSPYKESNYLYSSPWTFDNGVNYDKDFVNALNEGRVPSPAGGMYQLGSLGKLIASYANTKDHGVPYGYPYLLNDPTLGIVSHMLMDIRNDVGVGIYAPVGGTVCKGNSSEYAICAGDVTIDINDIRAIPNWQYGLKVTRGRLIGWTDPVKNITGQPKPFPLIHMGNFEHGNRAMTLAYFPYLTPEEIVMGAKPGPDGQIQVGSREQIVADYDYRVHLPHAPVYSGQ